MNEQQITVEEPLRARGENIVGRRVGAALIDIAILFGVFFVMSLMFGQAEAEDGRASVNLTGGPFLLYLLIVFVYYVGTEALFSATPGKLALGLKVVSGDTSELTFGRVALRNILRIVDGLPFLYLVGIITIAASKRDQRIGDMAANTIVVRASD